MKSNTLGLWKKGNRFVSSILLKQQIPAWCRVEFVKNPYKEKGDSRPDYLGYFIPVKEDKDKVIQRPLAVIRSLEEIKTEEEVISDFLVKHCESLLEVLEEDGDLRKYVHYILNK